MVFLSLLLFVAALFTTAAEAKRPDNSSLIWGPYRPDLYFGVRPQIHKTLLMGLMWARVEGDETVERDLRHACDENEGISYGWEAYDPRTGGLQTIHDTANHLDITTQIYTTPGAEHGGAWGARIKGVPTRDAPADLKTNVIFYTAMEDIMSDWASRLSCTNKEDRKYDYGSVECAGYTPAMGDFQFLIQEPEGNTYPMTFTIGLSLPEEKLFQAKDAFVEYVKRSTDSHLQSSHPKNKLPGSHKRFAKRDITKQNMHFVQRIFEGPFEFDILFRPESAPNTMTSTILSLGMQEVIPSMVSRFDAVFGPQPPFSSEDYKKFSRSLLSNLLGGIGYFYGDTRQALDNEEPENKEGRKSPSSKLTGDAELFGLTPSRESAPRSFLGDEGYHLLLVLDWDADLALEILRSWFERMDNDGWIAREQILGPQLRKVPLESQIQYPHYATPPTLFLVVATYVDMLVGRAEYSGAKAYRIDNKDAAKEYLKNLYPLLRRHYEWFRRTQRGDVKAYSQPEAEGYRWRGRKPGYTNTSGFSDYPRPEPPHSTELHVDAMSWVGSMASTLQLLASYLGESKEAEGFTTDRESVQQALHNLHWSKQHKTFCDATFAKNRHEFVCHKGYASLLPFLLEWLDTEEPTVSVSATLDLLGDKHGLWSPHGIRSLSKRDEAFGTGVNTARGAVWPSINYLVVKRLYEIAQEEGPYQARAREMYTALRRNLVETIYKEWKSTGYAWSAYDSETGKGQQVRDFTGWTALVVKIMAMPDLGAEVGVEGWREPMSFPSGARGWGSKWTVLFGLLFVFILAWRRRILVGVASLYRMVRPRKEESKVDILLHDMG